jgi:F420-dependent oxidoreductase-like protein
MRIGLASIGAQSIEDVVREVREARAASAYFGQVLGWDAISMAGIVGREVPGITVGTAVTQTYPRHPLALASQALTAQAITGNRFTLGIGPSHRTIVEGWFGYNYDRVVRHVREYLEALVPLLNGEDVDYHGETVTAVGRVEVPGTQAPAVLLAALGPAMLRLAGELADGTVTVWTGPEGIADHVAPTVRKWREDARVVVLVSACVTADPEGARERFAEALGFAGDLPSYRANLQRQGKAGVHETAVAGDEEAVARAVRAYAEAGATELVVSPFGDEREQERTRRLLAEL